MKTKWFPVWLVAGAVALLGCEPQGDSSGGSTNQVGPPTETNAVPQVNRPPESVTTNSAVPTTTPRLTWRQSAAQRAYFFPLR
jgi:hypothetical protein